MKRLAAALTALITAGILVPALSQDWSITAIARKSGLNWQEAAATVLLSELLDINATLILSTRRETKEPVFGLAPAFYIAKVSGQPVAVVWKGKGKGQGWGMVAHRLRVHPGVFNKSRVWLQKASDEEFNWVLWMMILSKVFKARAEQMSAWQKVGLSVGDMISLFQIAQGSQTPPDQVLSLWTKEKDWDKVRKKFGVSPDWLPPIKKIGREKPEEVESVREGNGKEKGKGRGRSR
ncbi:MAG: hypothetical protein NZ959_09705 [Armatimonadetes bacterium]|nr:hypothetical protein [Armatimonadota bacterium]MDW8121027.1 hypothetical protein [Armatimonadota bacterium]